MCMFFKKRLQLAKYVWGGGAWKQKWGGGCRQLKGDKMTSVNLQFSVHAMKFSLKILNEKFFSSFSVNF